MAPALVDSPPPSDNIVAKKAQTADAVMSQVPTPVATEVEITAEERASGIMSKQNIEKAIVALAEDGVVVLNNAVEEEALDLLNGRMVEEAK